jgi:hypothetical protein
MQTCQLQFCTFLRQCTPETASPANDVAGNLGHTNRCMSVFCHQHSSQSPKSISPPDTKCHIPTTQPHISPTASTAASLLPLPLPLLLQLAPLPLPHPPPSAACCSCRRRCCTSAAPAPGCCSTRAAVSPLRRDTSSSRQAAAARSGGCSWLTSACSTDTDKNTYFGRHQGAVDTDTRDGDLGSYEGPMCGEGERQRAHRHR